MSISCYNIMSSKIMNAIREGKNALEFKEGEID